MDLNRIRKLADLPLVESTITEGFTLSPKDKKVIMAFLDKKKMTGSKLDTDGKKLDGEWMGGTGIAKWEDKKIEMRDLGSKAADTVQKFIKKTAPKSDLMEATTLTEGMKEIKWDDIDNSTAQDIDWIRKRIGVKPSKYYDHGDKITFMFSGSPLFIKDLKSLIEAGVFKVDVTRKGDMSVTIKKSKNSAGKVVGNVPDGFTK